MINSFFFQCTYNVDTFIIAIISVILFVWAFFQKIKIADYITTCGKQIVKDLCIGVILMYFIQKSGDLYYSITHKKKFCNFSYFETDIFYKNRILYFIILIANFVNVLFSKVFKKYSNEISGFIINVCTICLILINMFSLIFYMGRLIQNNIIIILCPYLLFGVVAISHEVIRITQFFNWEISTLVSNIIYTLHVLMRYYFICVIISTQFPKIANCYVHKNILLCILVVLILMMIADIVDIWSSIVTNFYKLKIKFIDTCFSRLNYFYMTTTDLHQLFLILIVVIHNVILYQPTDTRSMINNQANVLSESQMQLYLKYTYNEISQSLAENTNLMSEIVNIICSYLNLIQLEPDEHCDSDFVDPKSNGTKFIFTYESKDEKLYPVLLSSVIDCISKIAIEWILDCNIKEASNKPVFISVDSGYFIGVIITKEEKDAHFPFTPQQYKEIRKKRNSIPSTKENQKMQLNTYQVTESMKLKIILDLKNKKICFAEFVKRSNLYKQIVSTQLILDESWDSFYCCLIIQKGEDDACITIVNFSEHTNTGNNTIPFCKSNSSLEWNEEEPCVEWK